MLIYLKSLSVIEILLIVGILVFRAALSPANRAIIGPKAIALTLLTPAVALLCGNVSIFYLYLVGAVGLTSRTRSELCATYLMMLPMTPVLGQQTGAGNIYLLPLSTILAMNTGALVGLLLTSPRKLPSFATLDVAAAMLVALFMSIDIRNASTPSISVVVRTTIVFFVQLGVPYLLISRGMANRADINRLLLRFAYAGTLCAIVGLFESSRHWVLYQSFNDALHIPQQLGSATLYMRGGRLRTGGMLVDYSAAGIFLACVIVAVPGLRSNFRRGQLALLCVVLLAGLIATQSRGAWIATVVGIATIMLYRGYKLRGVGFLLAAAAAQVLLNTVVAPSSKLAETIGTSGAGAMSGEYRKQLLNGGLRQIASHPLFGQSPSQLASNMSDLIQGQHIVDFVNTHLYIALAGGLLGFVLWIMVWLTPILLAWRNRPAGGLRESDLAEMPMAIIVTSMFALIFTSIIDRNLYWPAIALGLMGPCIALRRSRIRQFPQHPIVSFVNLSGQSGSAGTPMSAAT